MLLAIDGGNTNTVFGLRVGKHEYLTWRMASAPATTADDYAVWLAHHLGGHGYDFTAIDAVIISSVVPDSLPELVAFATRYLPVFTYILRADDESHGVKIAINKPEQAGADRIANTAAAAHEYRCPVIVVDFGTATTFDYISADGAYHGGVIAPGVNLSIDALYQAAARLPLIDPSHWHKDLPIIGKTTIEAMNSGLFFGYVSLVEGIITRMKTTIPEKSKITTIATGGLGAVFADAVEAIDHYDAHLTLKGLAVIAARVKETS